MHLDKVAQFRRAGDLAHAGGRCDGNDRTQNVLLDDDYLVTGMSIVHIHLRLGRVAHVLDHPPAHQERRAILGGECHLSGQPGAEQHRQVAFLERHHRAKVLLPCLPAHQVGDGDTLPGDGPGVVFAGGGGVVEGARSDL